LLWLLCLQDEQRAKRRAAEDAAAALSVVDKSTFASRQQALFTDTIKAGFREVMRADAQVRPHLGFLAWHHGI
jgi:hypothetical protein